MAALMFGLGSFTYLHVRTIFNFNCFNRLVIFPNVC